MSKIITNSSEETKKFAEDFAKKYFRGIIALTGNLGAGKTTFTQGFAKGLGIKDTINSPTFVLLKRYVVPDKKQFFFHLDLYRLENEQELKNLGIEEILENRENIILIEWAEKAENLLPKKYTNIYIDNLEEDKREIIVEELL